MARFARRQTPKVVDGRVQKKNSQSITNNYYDHAQREVFIDRKRPGPGYQHILKVEDIRKFIAILPDWEELSKGLKTIGRGEPYAEEYALKYMDRIWDDYLRLFPLY